MITYNLTWNGYPWMSGCHSLDDVEKEIKRLDDEYGKGKYKITRIMIITTIIRDDSCDFGD